MASRTLDPRVANVRRRTVKLANLEEELDAMDAEDKIRGLSEVVAEEKLKKDKRAQLDFASKKDRRLSRKVASDAKERAALMEWAREEGTTWDLTRSQTLTLESLVETLQERYARDLVYTYCGTILVALNPYKSIADRAYTLAIMQQYRSTPIGEHPPHVFAIADSAYREMMAGRQSVSVVISGESGAGKTETTKLILNYISSLNSEPTAVEAKLIESASLLEAFGNAKTVRNNNSSRFGKLIKILFDERSGLIAGAEIETYLLERSRVSHQDKGERNFHIFYALSEGATDEDRERYQLPGSAADYRYTETCVDLGLDEAAELQQIKDGLTLFGFSHAERDCIFTVVSAILHLGNVEFGYDQNRLRATIENTAVLETAAKLLQVSTPNLSKVLVERTLSVRGQTIRKGLLAVEAAGARDALCRMIYGAMFDWIVAKLNDGLKTRSKASASKFLGVLDIFGFENFATNSFEQLCINYANEKLHALFVDHVFTLEQQEYEREGLKWTPLSTKDNVECIDLIEGKLGVLALLDEESKLQAGTDESFLKKAVSTHGKSKYFKTSRLNANKAFVVAHYAEEVTYTVEGFREKNQNSLADDVKEVVLASKSTFVAALLSDAGVDLQAATNPAKSPSPPAKSATARGTNTSGFQFRKQLVALKTTLDATKPFFVRCIKPNALQKPNAFEATLVNAQLAYSGMLETVRIRQQGFAFRLEYPDLLERYRPMGINEATKKDATRFMTALVQSKLLKPAHFALGNTKLFLKPEGQLALERGLVEALRKWAVMIQAWVRMWSARKHFVAVCDATLVIQRNVRVVQRNARLKRVVMAALVVADRCEREREKRRRAAARRIQRSWRASKHNAHLKRCVVAALAVARLCEAERERVERERLAAIEAARLKKEAERVAREKAEAAELAQMRSEKERAERQRKQQQEAEERRRREAAEEEEEAERRRVEEENAQRRRREEEEAAEQEAAAAASAEAATIDDSSDEFIVPAMAPSPRREVPPIPSGAKPATGARASGTDASPRASPRRAAPRPPGSPAFAAKPEVVTAAYVSGSPSLRKSASTALPSLGTTNAGEDQRVAEIKAMQAPNNADELLALAKSLQRKVKGQSSAVADAMYAKAGEFYQRGLELREDCDAFVNAGTALINHANLRFIMPEYPSKSSACVPLLTLAEKMLERAISMGLDREGREALSLRILKCQDLRQQAMEEDFRKLTPEHRAKLAADIKARLDSIRPVDRQGKVSREEKGLMGRTVLKDFIMVLSAATVQIFVKTVNEKPKLDILLADVSVAKETLVRDKAAFALVAGTEFHPFICKDRAEMEAWIAAINTNMERLKLQAQLRKVQ